MKRIFSAILIAVLLVSSIDINAFANETNVLETEMHEEHEELKTQIENEEIEIQEENVEPETQEENLKSDDDSEQTTEVTILEEQEKQVEVSDNTPKLLSNNISSDFIASGTCGADGDNITWTLDNEGTLKITGKGKMANYRDYRSPWYSNHEFIKNIIIENGVTFIGNNSFSYCYNASKVTLPSSLTSIGEYAFSRCYDLENVVFPEKLESIGEYAFSWSNLKNVTIPKSVITISNGAFWGCEELDNIYFSKGISYIGSSVLYAEYSFSDIVTSIFYEGTYSDWNNITVNDTRIDKNTIHYDTKEHSWSEWYFWNEWENACSGGLMSRKCEVCEKEETIDASPQPHKFIAKINASGKVNAPICTVCDGEFYSWEEENARYTDWLTWDNKVDWAYLNDGVVIKPILSQKIFTADGTTNIPTVSVYVYLYDFGDYVCKYKIDKKYYDVKYSSDGKKSGTHKVTITFKGNYSGKLSKNYTVSASPMKAKTLDLYKGKSDTLKIPGTNGKITWSSTNKKVATVSSSGKVTAQNYGTCTIKAKFKGKTYTCKVKIPHHKPKLSGWISSYNTRSNKVTVYIKNNGKATVTIYSNGSKLIDWDYKSYDRTLKLSSGSSTTIKPGKGKYIKYKVKGSTTWPGVNRKDIRIKLKYDGKKYTRYISN